MVLIDQEKAFDRLEQNYLYKTLEKFGFGKKIISWTKILYNNIYSCIQVNGTLTDKIEYNRSMRQGCPLSMLVYVIAIEILIIKIKDNSRIKGIKVPKIKEEIKCYNMRMIAQTS